MGNRHQPNQDLDSEIRLGGLGIRFPYTPYPIQKAMLARIAVSLTNKENCLIESPTGTGKTLVLLCASLSWLKQSKKGSEPVISKRLRESLVEQKKQRLREKPCNCGRRPNARTELDELKEAKKQDGKGKKCLDDDDDCCESVSKKMKINEEHLETSPYFNKSAKDVKKKQSEPEFITIDSDDESNPIKEIKQEANVKSDKDDCIEIIDEVSCDTRKPLTETEPIKCKQNGKQDEMCKNCLAIEQYESFTSTMGEAGTPVKVGRIPRIYYGTRTHKQISQVVRELKKTPYTKDLRSCILSSRDRTCINDQIKDFADRNDKCQELIKTKSAKSAKSKSKSKTNETGCSYYRDNNNMAAEFERIYLDHADDAWDIEDSVAFGKTNCLCPYYGARSIQEQADITFCPYNYLLDSNIRKAMNINLNNAVIIFDEAHNIEDICRESASFTLNTQKIEEITSVIARSLPNYLQGTKISDAYYFFKRLFEDLKRCLVSFAFDKTKDAVKEGDVVNRHIMFNQEMRNFLQEAGLGAKVVDNYKENLNILRGGDDDSDDSKKDDGSDVVLSNNQLQDITQLFHTLSFIHQKDGKNSTDFRCIVSEYIERPKREARNGAASDPANPQNFRVFQLSLVCMDSGLAFEEIHKKAWSVIVASGTLSPIESLKTELGCTFAQIFEGSHVIPDDRIFATVLSQGPKMVNLNCSYQSSLKLDFQDEVGTVIRDVCTTVPNGILVFFPSYDRMENLYQRWFAKGIIGEIQASGKRLFREQRSSTAAKFEEELRKYHEAANRRGALLFAVFRGKASEGIDFSDTAARAVITLGIPYPNVKEVNVSLKRDYNDMARKDRPFLMTGRDWYAAQAFRALNQALGRCIRHKEDWGAIIMIDSRLRDQSSVNYISKWIRRVVTMPTDYRLVRDELVGFVERLSIKSN